MKKIINYKKLPFFEEFLGCFNLIQVRYFYGTQYNHEIQPNLNSHIFQWDLYQRHDRSDQPTSRRRPHARPRSSRRHRQRRARAWSACRVMSARHCQQEIMMMIMMMIMNIMIIRMRQSFFSPSGLLMFKIE